MKESKKRFLSLREQAAIEVERIERAREAKSRAKLAALGPPRPDPKPQGRENYFNGQYTGLTWRGHKIIIRKNKYGW